LFGQVAFQDQHTAVWICYQCAPVRELFPHHLRVFVVLVFRVATHHTSEFCTRGNYTGRASGATSSRCTAEKTSPPRSSMKPTTVTKELALTFDTEPISAMLRGSEPHSIFMPLRTEISD